MVSEKIKQLKIIYVEAGSNLLDELELLKRWQELCDCKGNDVHDGFNLLDEYNNLRLICLNCGGDKESE